MKIHITPNATNNPPGKLADAELHFDMPDLRTVLGNLVGYKHGEDEASDLAKLAELFPLDGLNLIGFGVWERRSGGGRNVTFPARTYSVNGERRSVALLRPTDAEYGVTNQKRLQDLILEAYAEYETTLPGTGTNQLPG